ncbi:MAG TPA: amidase [Thermomicrobiales bacterium]|nr:amidase [Thermomicrobiales bacterium]
MDPADLCYTPATELARLIRERALSPVELTEALLARIERLNPALNAYCTVTADEARAAARAAEAAVTRGDPLGPLHGVPVSIKDLTLTKGVRTTRGSRAYADFVPDIDAPPVERVKAAGGVVLGKTTTPEFGWKGDTSSPLLGTTHNPWDRTKSAGGSSGGAGVAVAAGLGPLAIGSDGAGSIRIPACFCGIVGLKPQLGRVPYYPGSGTETISHIGPMVRTVRDTALLLDVIAGPDERDRLTLPASGVDYLAACEGGVRGLRVAWSPDLGYAAVEPEVRDVAAAAARRFAADLGCELDEANPGFPDPSEPELLIFYAGEAANVADLDADRRALLDPEMVRAVEEETRGRTAADYARAIRARQELWDTTRRFFARYDLLLTPTIAVAPFTAGEEGPRVVAGREVPRFGWTPFTYPFNLTGQPALTVPAGWTTGGLPVGLQIVGRRYDEATVLRAGAAFEDAQPWADRRPSEELMVDS